MLAALYVATGGAYFGLEGVDPWDQPRDARQYPGPWPVVAHPPCQRWGRYWSGGPNMSAPRRKKGDDAGCFAAALAAVRRWGGVIEHPEATHAWKVFHINAPPRWGGWVEAGLFHPGAWTCCVEQGHYGHKSRKATWLYISGIDGKPPPLVWGRSAAAVKMDEGFHTAEERARRIKLGVVARLSKEERAATPAAFRDELVRLASLCGSKGTDLGHGGAGERK